MPKHKAKLSPNSRAPLGPDGAQGSTHPTLGPHPPAKCLPTTNKAFWALGPVNPNVSKLWVTFGVNLYQPGSFIPRPYGQGANPEIPIVMRPRLRELDTFRASKSAEGIGHLPPATWDIQRWLQDTGARQRKQPGAGIHMCWSWELNG